MTLDEAIKNNAVLLKHDYWTMTPINFASIKLGNEALKAIDKLRDYEHHVYPTDLPGETKD